MNCQTQNLIHLINCKKCPTQYIGETNRTLQARFSEHLGYATNKHTNKITGAHFNLTGHRQSDMEISIVSQSYVEIVKISKYITVNYNGIAQLVGFFFPFTKRSR